MGEAANAERLLVEKRDTTLVLTLNRPQVRNAIDLPLARSLDHALEGFDADPELAVAVLTGAGGGFCAGMDMKAFAETGQLPSLPDHGFAGIADRSLRKPLVAAIEGFAVAGGLEIALACDIIVASRGSVLSLPEVKRGLVAVGGGLLRLPRRLPAEVAMEMALTGNPIDADRAYALGAISRLTDPGQSLEAALQIAAEIAANGPLAVAASKAIVSRQRSWSPEEARVRQAEIAATALESADAVEGVAAFNESRAPRWRNR